MKIILQSLLLAIVIIVVVMGTAHVLVPQFNYNSQSTAPK